MEDKSFLTGVATDSHRLSSSSLEIDTNVNFEPVILPKKTIFQLISLLEQTTVYFGYDRSEIRPEFKDVLNAHAEYLAANPEMSIILEGHCDERGTVEYNLALGERRANTVKRYLIVQGVSPSQLDTVSFGEERPAMIGSDESVWSKNRRTEIKYQ